MDNEQIGSLTLKILAVYTFVLLINNIPHAVWIVNSGYLESQYGIVATLKNWALMFPLLALLIVLVIVLRFNRSLGRYLVDSDDDSTTAPDEGISWKQTLAFSVVGVALIASALPEMLGWIIKKMYAASKQPDYYSIVTWAEFSVHALQLFLGIILFFGARSLAGAWQKFKETTRPMRESE